MVKTNRIPRLAIVGVAAAGMLAFAGCSAGTTSTSADPAGGATSDGCGVVPETGAQDPNALLADFPAEIVDGYNLYPYEIRESAWGEYASAKDDGYTAAIVGMPPASPFIAAMSDAIRSSLD